jgi:hypothetical protein
MLLSPLSDRYADDFGNRPLRRDIIRKERPMAETTKSIDVNVPVRVAYD